MTYNTAQGVSGAASGAAAGASFGPWGALAGGALGALGGFGGGAKGGLSARAQIGLAQYQAQQEEKRMKNAHQWETEDLIKAGLNPALSARGSSAGSIAGNAGAAGGMLSNMATNLSNQGIANANRSTQSALDAARIFDAIKKTEAQNNLTTSQIRNTDADTTTKILNNGIIKKYGSARAKQNLANSILDGEEKSARTAAIRADTERTRQDININRPIAAQNKSYGDFMDKHSTIGGIVGATKDLGGFIGSIVKGKAALTAASRLGREKMTRIDSYNSKGELYGTKEIKRY